MVRSLALMVLAVLFMSISTARAGSIISSLGNTASGLTSGTQYPLADILTAQSGQPAPFDAVIGNEVIGPNFSADWTHSYGALTNVISAQITIGIFDNDAGSPGTQLASFTVAGTDLTGALNAAFEASAAISAEYDQYTVMLPGSLLAVLETGSAQVHLELQGPVVNPKFGGGTTEQPDNSAALIFSTLEITTQVPEPSTLVLLASAGLVVSIYKRRQRSAG